MIQENDVPGSLSDRRADGALVEMAVSRHRMFVIFRNNVSKRWNSYAFDFCHIIPFANW